MYQILKKVITNNPEILVKIFNAYIRPNYEYGSPIFNVSQKKNFAENIEFLQKTYTKRIFLRNNPNSSYDQIPDYQQRLLLYSMQTLEKRRLITDILMAWELLINHRNDQIDLDFHHISMETRFGRVYRTKSTLPPSSKYVNYHFSTRISTILNHYQIKLHDFASKDALRNHLQIH